LPALDLAHNFYGVNDTSDDMLYMVMRKYKLVLAQMAWNYSAFSKLPIFNYINYLSTLKSYIFKRISLVISLNFKV